MEDQEVKNTPVHNSANDDTERRTRVRRPLNHSRRVETHAFYQEPRRRKPGDSNDRYQHKPSDSRYDRAGGYNPRPYRDTNYAAEGRTRPTERPQYAPNAPRYDRPTTDESIPSYRQARHTSGAEGRTYQPQSQPRNQQDYRPNNMAPQAAVSKKKTKKKKSKRPITVVRYDEANVDVLQPIRLNKYLANAGVCSRREADEMITQGLVTVNDEVVTAMGARVLRSDVVMCQGRQVSLEKKVYVLLNKPKGFVTTCDDPQHRKMVVDLIRSACPERIYPVGRLDRNTTGVLLFTNDGELAAKLTHPSYVKKKIYHAFLNREVSEADMQALLQGIELDDGPMKADAVDYVEGDKTQVGIEIHSGRNRIVRRLFEKLGYQILKLDRVYFAGLTKKNLRRGQWRYLEPDEVNRLRMGAYE